MNTMKTALIVDTHKHENKENFCQLTVSLCSLSAYYRNQNLNINLSSSFGHKRLKLYLFELRCVVFVFNKRLKLYIFKLRCVVFVFKKRQVSKNNLLRALRDPREGLWMVRVKYLPTNFEF